LPKLKEFSKSLGMFGIWNRIMLVSDCNPVFGYINPDTWRQVTTLADLSSTPGNLFSYLGKLSLKFEAAGKIRVFAMVDAWTQ